MYKIYIMDVNQKVFYIFNFRESQNGLVKVKRELNVLKIYRYAHTLTRTSNLEKTTFDKYFGNICTDANSICTRCQQRLYNLKKIKKKTKIKILIEILIAH